MKKEPTAV